MKPPPSLIMTTENIGNTIIGNGQTGFMGFQLMEIQSNGCFPVIYMSQIRVRIKNQKLHTREAWICDSSMLRKNIQKKHTFSQMVVRW